MKAQSESEHHTAFGNGKDVQTSLKAVLSLPLGRVERASDCHIKGFDGDTLIFKASKVRKHSWACTYIGPHWEKV